MFPDFLTPDLLAFLAAAALLAGFIDAIAGGGGLITIPALLSAGLPPAAALATNKLQGSFGTAMSTYTFWRAGQIEIRPMLFTVGCVFIGAGAGTFAVQYVGAGFLTALIPILLVAIALYFLLSPRAGDVEAQARLSLKAFSLTVGIGVGFYDGFFGPGTGSFFALGCVALLGMNMRRATANTKLLNFTSNVVSLAVFALGGEMVWAVGLLMAAGQMAGSWLGSHAALRFGARLVRPLLVLVCLGMTVRLVANPSHPLYGWAQSLFQTL
ncbi:TSUP family transporter [Niveispirillum irakense]|uniref:TSUP family transporter n=1 Tax=Niveispirillum irakense TaxID=34011 RepID=UPI000413BCFA|nr:TSUP family transporter [Niveispirillum irakense]